MMKYSINSNHNIRIDIHHLPDGYGVFPYIMVKVGHALYMQIPIHFNVYTDYGKFPGTHVNNIPDEILESYAKDKSALLHDILIERVKEIKAMIEEKKGKPARLCLVEAVDIGYYFDNDEIKFNKSIPAGGTLLTQDLKVIRMNGNHYISPWTLSHN